MTAAEACPLNWSCEPRAHNCHTEKQSLGKGLWELEMEEALLLSVMLVTQEALLEASHAISAHVI
jgi:hypothetical protein